MLEIVVPQIVTTIIMVMLLLLCVLMMFVAFPVEMSMLTILGICCVILWFILAILGVINSDLNMVHWSMGK